MRSNVSVFSLLLIFNTVLHTYSTASYVGLDQENSEKNGGYRCGKTVYSYKDLKNAAKQARDQFTDNFLSFNNNLEPSIFPMTYDKKLEFNEDGELLLWPLKVQGQISLSPGDDYLVIGEKFSKVVGVFWQHENQQVKCIQEPNLSDTYRQNFAIGYRCPQAIFPFEIIERAIATAKANYERKLNYITEDYPKQFSGSQIFNNMQDSMWSWPILSDGSFNSEATVSVIIDEQFQLIGMVHSEDDTYYSRCMLTVNHQIKHKFVDQAFRLQPTKVEVGILDVFQCGDKYILSDQILEAVDSSPRKVADTRKISQHTWFSASHQPLPVPTQQDLSNIPIRIDRKGCLSKAHSFSPNDKYFAVTDSFSDIHGVIMGNPDTSYINCSRTTVKDEIYRRSRVSYCPIRGQKRKKISSINDNTSETRQRHS